jgi:hypothetical protein
MARPTRRPPVARPDPRRGQAVQLGDLAAQVLTTHSADRGGSCAGCRHVQRMVMPWPCTFVRLAWLAEKIVEGKIGER